MNITKGKTIYLYGDYTQERLIEIKNRKSEQFYASILQMKEVLRGGGVVSIGSVHENDYINKVIATLKKEGLNNVSYERITRKHPHSPFKIIYDDFSEPIGMETVAQIDKFTGWKIWTHNT